MSLARFAVKQVVLMNLLFLVLIGAGVAMMNLLPVEVYPDVSLDLATITTPWLGASSEEIERLITTKIEDEIEDVRGCDRIISISQPDVSVITVKFREDLGPRNFEAAFDDLRARLDRVTDLPDDAEEPQLERLTTDEVMPLLQVGVINTGNVEETVLRRVALDLKDELRVLPGISRVKLVGDREPEIHIFLDKAQLEKYGLSPVQVAAILESDNFNLPAGNLQVGDNEITLRSVGQVAEPRELGDVCIVRSATGAHVRLRDMARIEESFARAVWAARIDGKPSIMLYIAKDKAANSLSVREVVGERISAYQENLTLDGVSIEIQSDSTSIIAGRLAVLKNNMIVGLAMIFVVLWIIIGARNSLLAIVGIPFSFLCAMIFMHAIGVSLNAVSVFSLVLVSGMIVDDAIVVLENIYRHTQAGLPLREAVIVGTDEVMWPVVSSTLTTVAAFLPLLVMTGVLGEFFAIIPKTVTVALVASLFECLLILPVHYLDWGPRAKSGVAKPKVLPETKKPGRFGTAVVRVYDVILGQFLAYRALAPVMLLVIGIFIWQCQRTLTVEMFPSDFPTFIVDFEARPGSSLDATDRAVSQFTPVLDKFRPETVVRYSTAVGVQFNEDNQRIMRTDIAQMWVDVATGDKAFIDPSQVMSNVRTAMNDYLESHPTCGIERIKVWPIRDGPPVGKPVAIRVEHPNYDFAKSVADRIEQKLRGMPGVEDVSDNLQIGNRELILTVNDAKASEHGVTFRDVALAVRGAKDGLPVGVYKDTVHDEDVDIKVRYDERFIGGVDDLADIDIISQVTGATIKLREVADLHFEVGYTNRYHYDTKRAVMVTADVDTNVTDAQIVNKAILGEFAAIAEGNDKLTIHAGGQFEETQASFGSLKYSAVIALGLMYMILATQFRSYIQPFVVLTAVVFGVMGMILGLVINNYPFSVVTAIAMVGLCGVVVNDALVLLDFINNERRRGTPMIAAVHEACRLRMRPILLTTVTTVVGLAPMAAGVGGYSKIWSPFAMSMCWGLGMSTILTLLVVPAFYCILEESQTYLQNLFGLSKSESNVGDASAVGDQ